MHIKQDISNWNIIIILSVLIGACNARHRTTLYTFLNVLGSNGSNYNFIQNGLHSMKNYWINM